MTTQDMKGYSTTIKMEPELYQDFKALMQRLKERRNLYGRTFKVTDLLGAICQMPDDLLYEQVDNYMLGDQLIASKIASASPEAKAKIEAILAQEAKKGQ